MFISFHSYGQRVLFPFGHTQLHAPNHDHLKQIGLRIQEAIAKRFGTEYTVGSVISASLAPGNSIDWVYATRNVDLTFAFEFRDKRKYGFLLPADQIISNSLEVNDGLKAMVQEAKKIKYF